MPSKPYRLDPGQIEVMDDAMVEVLKKKSGGERLKMMSDMYEFARRLVNSRVRELHPQWSENQVIAEVARRLSHGAV